MEWDVFISHASEDKESFVRPLAKRLQQHGLRVWFDELTLTVGDSLRRSIDRGLARSRYGIVVISPDFLKKEWPQKELDGLVAREIEGIKVILPVWHNIGAEEIRAFSPMLADRLAAPSSAGLHHVAERLLEAIRQTPSTVSLALARPEQSADGAAQSRGYATKLHKQRIAQLLDGNGPVPILDGGALVLHVVPNDANDDHPESAFEAISKTSDRFPPISSTSSYARDVRISYDGLLIGSNAEGLSKPQRAYVSVSRSAVVEAVQSSLASGPEHDYLILPQIQASVIKYACVYSRALSDFMVRPPFSVCVSLVNVQSMKLLRDFAPRGALLVDLPCSNLDRNSYDFGHATFTTPPRNYKEAATNLRPILTHLANAAGLHSSPYFDAAGNYELADKL